MKDEQNTGCAEHNEEEKNRRSGDVHRKDLSSHIGRTGGDSIAIYATGCEIASDS
jgi:hypothetical protein